MNNTNEPISDITAEIRAARNTSSDTTLVRSNWLDDWADRIERTANNMECAFGMALAIKDGLHKRDKLSAPGNAAAMRETLRYVLQFDATDEAAEEDGLTDAERIAEYADHIEECQKKARAALAVPARNCDRFMRLEDAIAAYKKECPVDQDNVLRMTFDSWLFATAKQNGGAK